MGTGKPFEPIEFEAIDRWNEEADVVIVGFGAAGASAAIEAANYGADVLVLEAGAEGGGTTAMAGGQIYFGGGTPTQISCGIEDSLDDMYQYLLLSCGPGIDKARVQLYVKENLNHYHWLLEQGMEFKPELVTKKQNNTHGDEGLIGSGNEECYPFDTVAKPAPRGHKGRAMGEGGGRLLMNCLISSAKKKGVRALMEARVLTTVVASRDDEGTAIVGVQARINGRHQYIRARKGVVLCAGGFIMNESMVQKFAPRLLNSNFLLGNPNDNGSGIQIGLGAGGSVLNMHEGFVSLPFYPPSEMVEGMLVNSAGRRVVNEDCYHGKMGDLMFAAPKERFYMIIDSRHFDLLEKPPPAGYGTAAVEDTIEELESALLLPEGSLRSTLKQFNSFAKKGQDPLFHKRKPYLVPLDQPPYAALDFSMNGGAWFPAFTFGGLAIDLEGRVLRANNEAVKGLYAAGRTSAGLPRSGASYSSGISIADATFFGRRAGLAAARYSKSCR